VSRTTCHWQNLQRYTGVVAVDPAAVQAAATALLDPEGS
jgi:hypothetical protein